MTRQSTKWEELLATHTTNKELTEYIKNSFKSIRKWQRAQQKSQAKDVNRPVIEEEIHMVNKQKKMLRLIGSQGNES